MPDDAIEREHWSRQSIAGIVIQAIVASRSGKGMALPAGRAADEILTLLAPAFASQQTPEGWRPIDTAWQAGSNPVIVTDGQSVHGGAWWHSREEAWLGCDGIVPTHWRPLPAPPAMLDAAPSVTLGEVG